MNIRHAFSRGAALVFLLAAACNSFGQKNRNAPRIVTSFCSGCHGVNGNAELPYIPKLAGINLAYARKRLRDFKQPTSPAVDELFGRLRNGSDRGTETAIPTRQERINMQGVTHAVRAELALAAVQWYSAQPPISGHSARNPLIGQGEHLFVNGVREQKALACMQCHGRDAQGNGLAPRLAGQNAEYLEAQLAKFRQGDQRSAPEMKMVARQLDSAQARAAALYLQSR